MKLTLPPSSSSGVSAVLQSAGIKPVEKRLDSRDPRDILNDSGASISAAAYALGNLLNSDDEQVQVAAARMTMQAHGLLKNTVDQTPTIQINIGDTGNGGRSIDTLIIPEPVFGGELNV